jgi:hypothetical protein
MCKGSIDETHFIAQRFAHNIQSYELANHRCRQVAVGEVAARLELTLVS